MIVSTVTGTTPTTPSSATISQPSTRAIKKIRLRSGKTDGPWVLVVGIETIPDRGSLPVSINPDAIPKIIFQQVVAIAFVRALVHKDPDGERYEVVECRAGGTPELDEATLLAGFWRQFKKWKPFLAGFNSRKFIVPVLRYRSMRHKLSADFLHTAGDSYRSYLTTEANSFQVDVMDAVSDQYPSPSLAETALALGLPTRSQEFLDPEVLVAEGKIEDVRAIAIADVATTFLAMIRWKLLKGDMTLASHDSAAASLRDALEDIDSPGPAVTQIINAWPPS